MALLSEGANSDSGAVAMEIVVRKARSCTELIMSGMGLFHAVPQRGSSPVSDACFVVYVMLGSLADRNDCMWSWNILQQAWECRRLLLGL